jgi:Putative bacterial sensory transduction regulator
VDTRRQPRLNFPTVAFERAAAKFRACLWFEHFTRGEKTMRPLIIAALLALAAASPLQAAPKQPDIVDQGVTRVELIEILSSFGMTVKDATTQESDPWLSAKTPKGVDFYINMYDCVGSGPESRRCNNLQFLAQWELSKYANLASANVYNQKFVFGRAYLNKEGKMFMFDYSVNIKDGVVKDNLKRHVDNWLRVLDDIRTLLKV